MTYEAWRISYQSSEQAARAAYAECVQSQAKVEATEKERDALRAELDALKTWKAEVEARVAGEQPAPSAPVGLITDYFVSISDHVAHQEEPKTQAETGDLLRMLAAIPCAQPAPSVPDDMIEQAVTRFLSWKLPKDFHPDGGVVFIPTKGRGYDSPHWPCGTNLLNAQQARDMLRHVLAAAPEAKP